jgi:2-phospho-L-lactate guanylyltransferase
MRVLVPFDATDPKSRLAPVLDSHERQAFSQAMLADVVETLRATERDLTIRVVATDELSREPPAAVEVDDRPLSPAIDARLDPTATEPVAVVMADLALATPAALTRLFDSPAPLVFVPGLGGGTNAILARHGGLEVDYHGLSIADHRRGAERVGLRWSELDSFRLAMDIDEPDDLLEVLIHTDGRARTWLDRAGFGIDVSAAGPALSRDR